MGVAGAGLLVWRVQGWYDRGLGELVPAVQRPGPWVVDRPDKASQVVAAHCGDDRLSVTHAPRLVEPWKARGRG